jgi:type II secretory pathway pseudopilin PulG
MNQTGRAFSLVELLVIVVAMGLLAALVAPRFAGASDDARSSAAEQAVARARAGLVSFHEGAEANGEPRFPTIEELVAPGRMKISVPANPYTGQPGVQLVTGMQADARAVVNEGRAGWNYFYDNTADPPEAVLYLNCDRPTTVPDGEGGTLRANEL